MPYWTADISRHGATLWAASEPSDLEHPGGAAQQKRGRNAGFLERSEDRFLGIIF